MPEEKSGCAGWIIFGAVALIVVLAISHFITGSGDTSKNDIDALVMAEKFVKKKLISPGTAKFSSTEETQIQRTGASTWTVMGWVDSQNVFGALIRKRYRVTLQFLGEDQWQASEVLVVDP